MTAIATPYRQGESMLAERERALETELRATREKLEEYANEEHRVARLVRLKEARESDLIAVESAIAFFLAEEERLGVELEHVRAEMVARGERRVITGQARPPEATVNARFVIGWLAAFLLLAFVVSSIKGDTAHTAPPGATYEWGGPLAPGNTWLYVEDPRGFSTLVDDMPTGSSGRVEVDARRAHSVAFAGNQRVVVHWVPCTTALVVWDRGPSVKRFFNSSTCF